MKKMVYHPKGYFDVKFNLTTDKGVTEAVRFLNGQVNTTELRKIIGDNLHSDEVILSGCYIDPEHYKQTT